MYLLQTINGKIMPKIWILYIAKTTAEKSRDQDPSFSDPEPHQNITEPGHCSIR